MKETSTVLGPVRIAVAIWMLLPMAFHAQGQGGDKELRTNADALFEKGEYARAYPMYSQLVSLAPQDRELNYRFGACTLYGGDDKEKAVGYLKYAVEGPATANLAWYFLGRAYQLDYRFDDAIAAYQHYHGTADKKLLARFPSDALEQQCRNGKYLLSNIKDIEVLSKVEVDASDFFRFYDLKDIGGKIVVTPDELLTNLDRKSGDRSLTYLPTGGGPIYFSSYGKDGKTGKDIYRSDVMVSGGYSTPVKLAGYINTDQDEDYAVMAPDGKTFYFCSKGHNSMGGYDVFKSTYDKGMDTFSAPENMDFAVNTPADEMLYIVGPDGKQACFASDRDSKQGMLNVYRVGTTQSPINITVLKGTYASAFDPSDRRAHIIVEDDLTRERVADVITDMNGEYLLALPRSGKYKFLVEGGPNGLTHLASVTVPPSDAPKAYRQETKLIDQGGEKVMITNYFDQPLDEDVMALAMDDIRRRARLDVTGTKAPTPQAEATSRSDDPLQAAGFDGTMTITKAVELARSDAESRNNLAEQQAKQTSIAFALALESVSAAEDASKQARALVQEADAKTDVGEKDRLMTLAAGVKQRSMEANSRARAAYRTAKEMDSARMGTQQQAATAESLRIALTQATTANDRAATTTALKQLKARIDAEKGPDATLDEAERTRRAATEAAQEATKKLKQANAQSGDENALTERSVRLKRDIEGAKGKKKEEMQKQLAELEEQRSALHQEVEAAFWKARVAEDAAALARGQAALVRYLEATPDSASAPVPKDMVAGIEQRLMDVRTGNETLVIERKYDPAASEPAEARERRTFDWGMGSALAYTGSDIQRTVAQPGALHEGQRTEAAGTTSKNAPVAQGTTANSQGSTPPTTGTNIPASNTATGSLQSGNGKDVASSESTGNFPNVVPSGITVGVSGKDATNSDGTDASAQTASRANAGEPSSSHTSGVPPNSIPEAGQRDLAVAPAVSIPGARSAGNDDPVAAMNANLAELEQLRSMETDKAEQDSLDLAIARQRKQIQDHQEEQAFLLANQLAELEQARAGEKNKVKQDSLDQSIAAQRLLMQANSDVSAAAITRTVPAPGNKMVPVQYEVLQFDPATMDAQLAEETYPGFNLRRKQIMEGPGDAKDKAAMLHALEMDLVDSIDVRSSGLVAYLDSKPEAASEVLPQLERLRQLKASHVESAANVLAGVDQEYAASETRAMEDAQLSVKASPPASLTGGQTTPTPHNDAYITVLPDLDAVYSSPLAPRSKKVAEAMAMKDKDLQHAADLKVEIDSMEAVLEGMPGGKGYDQLRQRTDRKIDDQLIGNVELGQRMSFITRSEYVAAKDSAKGLVNKLSGLGLPPDEPLVQMAKSLQAGADEAMVRAKGMRKDADRSEDIFKRNSLYQQAYGEELSALRDYDRSHTVRNYLLSGKAKPGEALTYDEVEQRMFPASFRTLAENSKAVGTQRDTSDAGASIAQTGADPSGAPSGNTSAKGTVQEGVSIGLHAPAIIGAPKNTGGTSDGELLSGYMDRFYYLDPAERATVLGGEEESRYFLMKGRAMQERSDAEAARTEADGGVKLAEALRGEADAIRSANGQGATTDKEEQAKRLDVRADALMGRSDSLASLSERSLAVAAMNDSQAASLLASLPAGRSAAIMDLEQGKRRTEATLARTRPAQQDSAMGGTMVAVRTIPRPVTENGSSATGATGASGTTDPVNAPAAQPDRVALGTDRMARISPTVGTAPLPFSGPLVKDVFTFTGTAAPRDEAIPIDAPMPEGVVYKVQVGAFRNALPTEAFSDMTPVTGERTSNGLIRYTAGMFTSAEGAIKAGASVRDRGYRDAFVVAYMDGKRVPLRDAIQAERSRTTLPITAIATAQVPVPPTPVGGVPEPHQIVPAPASNATASQDASEVAVLAQYAASAEEVLAAFKPVVLDYYNDPTAAPAKQVEAVKGLFFTVQVGVYSKPTPLDRLFNITPLNSELTATGKIRYTTGIFRSEGQALVRKEGTVALGVTDAFVTAYLNGKRIPIRDARALFAKFGKDVLVAPGEATE